VKRKAIRRLPGLTQGEWEKLREVVVTRDLLRAYMHQPEGTPWVTFIRTGTPCVARFLDRSESGPCSGAIQLDHVKCQPMIAKKAPDNKRHLVSVCRGHHTDTRAGAQWATSHRQLQRAYLEILYGPCTECE